MRFFKDHDERAYSKARRRLRRVDKGVSLQWGDTTLWGIQAALDEYRREQARDALEMARTGAVGLLAVCDDLLDRQP